MTKNDKNLKAETLALHGGQEADPTTGARAVPIYQTTSYVFKNTEHAANLFGLKEFGNIYTRLMNPTTDVLEKRIAALDGGAGALAVASGQSAITLALLNIAQAGDEIISADNLYGGTYTLFRYTFKRLGVKVNFVPSGDLNAFEKAITPKTKAIVPVHLYGQLAEMDPIIEIARVHNLFVAEDACQAHGAEYKNRRAGSIGDAGCFSFYPGKNLGAYGEAGAVVTNDRELAEKLRMFRDHGQRRKYHHSIIGWNGRMDGFQGAVLDVKLPYLSAWTDARRKNAKLYDELLDGVAGITIPFEADYARHVYHVYAIRTERRDELLKFLAEQGISCGIHYPVPVHLQEAYTSLGYKIGDFPKAEEAAERVLSLPMYPELTEEQINYVAEKIKDFFN